MESYTAFDRDNDPHGDRAFGDLVLFNAELLWKIEYYDRKLKFASDDPADAAIKTRTLAVMLTTEY